MKRDQEKLEAHLFALNIQCCHSSGHPHFQFWSNKRALVLKQLAVFRPLTVLEGMNLGFKYDFLKKLVRNGSATVEFQQECIRIVDDEEA